MLFFALTPSDPVHPVKTMVGKEKQQYYFFQKSGSFSTFYLRHETPVAAVLFPLKDRAKGLRSIGGAIHRGKVPLKLFLNTVLNNVLFMLHYFIYQPTFVCCMTLTGPGHSCFTCIITETITMKDYYEENTEV